MPPTAVARRHSRRNGGIGFAAVALTLFAAGPASTGAQAVGEDFGGYQAAGFAEVMGFHPVVPGFTVVEEPFSGQVSLAVANLATGGSAFSRASTAWPGDLPGNLGSLLGAAAPVPVPVPNYPIKAEAREFDGTKTFDAPGVTVRAEGSPAAARATAENGAVRLPGVYEMGQSSGVGFSKIEPGRVSSEGVARIQDLKVGVLSIDSIMSVATASTDGTKAVTGGNLVVTGAKVIASPGQEFPVTIDTKGVKAAGQGVPGVDPNAQVAQLLAASGLTVRTLGNDSSNTGSEATRGTGGLQITMKIPGAAAVPPCACTFIIGSTRATVAATPVSESLDDFDPPTDFLSGDGAGVDPSVLGSGFNGGDTGSTGGFDGGPTGTGSDSSLGGTGTSGGATDLALSSPLGAGDTTAQNAAYQYSGISTAMVVGFGLIGVIGARRIRRYMELLLDMGTAA